MNYLILGGLGYLGERLYSHLKQSHEVHILDNNVYGRWEQSELNVFGDKLHICNLVSTELSKRDLNWCCDIDVVISCLPTPDLDFLSKKPYQKYHTQLLSNIGLLGKAVKKDATFVHFQDTDVHDMTIYDYLHELETRIGLDTSILPKPSLYGFASAFDNSTFLNNCILSFNAEKVFFLEGNPYESVSFMEINQYSKYVTDLMLGYSDKEFNPDKLPKSMLASIVQELFGATEHEIQIDISSERNFSIEENIKFVNIEMLKSFINQVQTGFKKGIMQELYSDKYNSKTIYNLIKIANEYKEYVV